MAMVGSDRYDLFFIIGLAVLAPLGLIVGIIAVLVSLNVSGWIIAAITVFNVLLIGYLLYHWEVVESLKNTVESFMYAN